jgi:hypothetical protein
VSDDRLQALQRQLETVVELPVEDRPEVFEQAHAALVAELNALEEV